MEFMFNSGIPSHLRHELGQISADWRGDNPETGFSMGLGRLMSSEDPDCLLAIAYDPGGEPIGFAYLVPVYPRIGYSLDITRTSRDTSNGINEYIFTRTALFLKERGYRFMSLHFAAFSQHYRKDRKEDGSRMVRAICRVVDLFLPMMSLYDFDRKFQPSWKKRYLVFDSYADIPRLGVTAVTIESFYKLMRRVKRGG
jgi:lysyl-tRNA synthetase class 2